jgi:cystine transport system substrate-binding protein
VRAHPRTDAARLAAALTGLLLVAAVPVAVGADSTSPQSRAAGLRAESGSLAARIDAATLELYALETEAGRVRGELAALEAQRRELAREQAAARVQLRAARRTVGASQNRLADLVRALYEQPGHDPLAILLSATSLDEALTALDGLDRAAAQNERIIAQAQGAVKKLAAAQERLAARGAALTRAARAAAAAAESLEATAAARRQFVAGLRAQQDLTEARIASIEQQARVAERRTATLAPTPAAVAAAPAPAATPEREMSAAAPVVPSVTATGETTLTVLATAYAIQGRTATGIPTGPGVVAVDPAVIPLGTRMTIPGYGTGIAADSGGAVVGAKIDVWFPTIEEALAWGQRTVTITIH